MSTEGAKEVTRLFTDLCSAKKIIHDLLATRPAFPGLGCEEYEEAIGNAVEFLADETLR
jgi:hypothetical protein